MTILAAACPAPVTTAGRRSRGWLFAALGLWCVLAAAGLYGVSRYQSAAGEPGEPPTVWPRTSTIARDGRPALLFFAHPRCPCTRSSLVELNRLVAECGDRVDVHVIMIMPDAAAESWHEAELMTVAQDMPGITTHQDVGRRESRTFGARSSGTCLLYDADGRLLFRGGLTISRGEEGPSPGADRLRSLVLGTDTSAGGNAPVFGCPLFENGAMPVGREAN